MFVRVRNFSPTHSTPPVTGCSDPSAAPTAGNIVWNLQRNCCQGPPAILVEPLRRQQNASLLAKNKMVVESQYPSPHPLFADHASCDFLLFPGMNQDLKGRRSADFAEVQRESLVAIDSIFVEDFRQCFQQSERRWDRCIQSQGEYCEWDWSFRLVRIY